MIAKRYPHNHNEFCSWDSYVFRYKIETYIIKCLHLYQENEYAAA